jgi:hypothetical protein
MTYERESDYCARLIQVVSNSIPTFMCIVKEKIFFLQQRLLTTGRKCRIWKAISRTFLMNWAVSTYAESPLPFVIKFERTCSKNVIMHEELCLLVYNVMQSGESLQRDISPLSSWLLPASCLFRTLLTFGPCRWRRCVPLKRWLTFTGLHGAIYPQTELFIATTVKPSNPILASSLLQAAYVLRLFKKKTVTKLKAWLLSRANFTELDLVTKISSS